MTLFIIRNGGLLLDLVFLTLLSHVLDRFFVSMLVSQIIFHIYIHYWKTYLISAASFLHKNSKSFWLPPSLFFSSSPWPQPLLWIIHNCSIRISFWGLSPASFWTLRPGETKGSKSSFYNFLRYFKTQTNWVCLAVTTSLWNFLMARWPSSRIPVTSDFPCRASELARIRSRVLILSLLKDEIIMWVSDSQPCCTLESLGDC